MDSREKKEINKRLGSAMDEVDKRQDVKIAGLQDDVAAIWQVLIDQGIWPQVKAAPPVKAVKEKKSANK